MPLVPLYITDTYADVILDDVFRNTQTLSSLYCGLSTTAPNPNGSSFTEPVLANYARVPVSWGAASSRGISNIAPVVFPKSSGIWGTITHVGLFAAITGGTPVAYGALDSSLVIPPRSTVSFPISGLRIYL